MFPCRIFVGMYPSSFPVTFVFSKCYLLQYKFFPCSSSDFVTECLTTGHECQSNRNCLEANIIRNEPANISSNVDIYFSCDYLCAHPDELFKQGMLCSFRVFSETFLALALYCYDMIVMVHRVNNLISGNFYKKIGIDSYSTMSI